MMLTQAMKPSHLLLHIAARFLSVAERAIGGLGIALAQGPRKLKNASLALLVIVGLMLSTVSASAYTYRGYNISPYAVLQNASLCGAKLTNAVLYYADLTGANLTGANLSGANLTGADLTDVNLTGANMTNVNLTGATVSYSSWADFLKNSGAQFLGKYSYDTCLIIYSKAQPRK